MTSVWTFMIDLLYFPISAASGIFVLIAMSSVHDIGIGMGVPIGLRGRKEERISPLLIRRSGAASPPSCTLLG